MVITLKEVLPFTVANEQNTNFSIIIEAISYKWQHQNLLYI